MTTTPGLPGQKGERDEEKAYQENRFSAFDRRDDRVLFARTSRRRVLRVQSDRPREIQTRALQSRRRMGVAAEMG